LAICASATAGGNFGECSFTAEIHINGESRHTHSFHFIASDMHILMGHYKEWINVSVDENYKLILSSNRKSIHKSYRAVQVQTSIIVSSSHHPNILKGNTNTAPARHQLLQGI
jgi:hypothetical protein